MATTPTKQDLAVTAPFTAGGVVSLELQAAKIMTVGERAEDVFYVTDFDHRPLTDAAAERLKSQLTLALDRRRAA